MCRVARHDYDYKRNYKEEKKILPKKKTNGKKGRNKKTKKASGRNKEDAIVLEDCGDDDNEANVCVEGLDVLKFNMVDDDMEVDSVVAFETVFSDELVGV